MSGGQTGVGVVTPKPCSLKVVLSAWSGNALVGAVRRGRRGGPHPSRSWPVSGAGSAPLFLGVLQGVYLHADVPACVRTHVHTHTYSPPSPTPTRGGVSYLQCLRLFKLLLFFWLSNDVVPCQFTKSLLAPPPLCHLSLARPTRACPSGRADGFPGVGVRGG